MTLFTAAEVQSYISWRYFYGVALEYNTQLRNSPWGRVMNASSGSSSSCCCSVSCFFLGMPVSRRKKILYVRGKAVGLADAYRQ